MITVTHACGHPQACRFDELAAKLVAQGKRTQEYADEFIASQRRWLECNLCPTCYCAAKEADPAHERLSTFNLDSALNLHCGAMSVLVESPAHDFSTAERNGKPFVHTPEDLLDAQLIAHQEAMKFLAETGGRARWTAKK